MKYNPSRIMYNFSLLIMKYSNIIYRLYQRVKEYEAQWLAFHNSKKHNTYAKNEK